MTNVLVCANLCFAFKTFGRYTQKGIHKMRKTVPFKIVLLFTIFIMLLTGCKARDQKSADQNVESADKQQEETSLDTASQKSAEKCFCDGYLYDGVRIWRKCRGIRGRGNR